MNLTGGEEKMLAHARARCQELHRLLLIETVEPALLHEAVRKHKQIGSTLDYLTQKIKTEDEHNTLPKSRRGIGPAPERADAGPGSPRELARTTAPAAAAGTTGDSAATKHAP